MWVHMSWNDNFNIFFSCSNATCAWNQKIKIPFYQSQQLWLSIRLWFPIWWCDYKNCWKVKLILRAYVGVKHMIVIVIVKIDYFQYLQTHDSWTIYFSIYTSPWTRIVKGCWMLFKDSLGLRFLKPQQLFWIWDVVK